MDPEYQGYKGRNVSLECPAKGFPLHVEWKFKKKGEDKVRSCIGMFPSHFALNWKQALHNFRQFYFLEILQVRWITISVVLSRTLAKNGRFQFYRN